MKLESIKGIIIARLVLDDLDIQLVKDRDRQKLIERAVGKLSSVIDPGLIEGPVIDIQENILEIGFAVSGHGRRGRGNRR